MTKTKITKEEQEKHARYLKQVEEHNKVARTDAARINPDSIDVWVARYRARQSQIAEQEKAATKKGCKASGKSTSTKRAN